MFDFPSAPTDGQVVSFVEGPSYKWNAASTAWDRQASAATPPPIVQPVLTSIDPIAIGFLDPATLMHVYGANFVASSVILWDLAEVPTTLVSDTELTTPLDPARVAGTPWDIMVDVRTPPYDSVPPPKVCHIDVNPYTTSFTPTTAPAGAQLTLVCTGYMYQTDVGMESKVTWDGVPVPTVINNATTITGTVPANLVTTGVHQVNTCGGDPPTVGHDPAYPDLPFTVT